MKGLDFTYKSDVGLTNEVMKKLDQQEWAEWKEVNWYKQAPLIKPGIPAGKHCNPTFEKWCPYCVGDNCLKYGSKLFSTCRISAEFSGLLKDNQCKKEYPKGLDMTQLSIYDTI